MAGKGGPAGKAQHGSIRGAGSRGQGAQEDTLVQHFKAMMIRAGGLGGNA